MSLQEIIIPVVSINKKRESDSSPVDITILTGSSTTISTYQHSVKLYQELPVTEKTYSRTLKIGLYGDDGRLLSNQQTIKFDIDSSNARDRELKLQIKSEFEKSCFNWNHRYQI